MVGKAPADPLDPHMCEPNARKQVACGLDAAGEAPVGLAAEECVALLGPAAGHPGEEQRCHQQEVEGLQVREGRHGPPMAAPSEKAPEVCTLRGREMAQLVLCDARERASMVVHKAPSIQCPREIYDAHGHFLGEADGFVPDPGSGGLGIELEIEEQARDLLDTELSRAWLGSDKVARVRRDRMILDLSLTELRLLLRDRSMRSLPEAAWEELGT